MKTPLAILAAVLMTLSTAPTALGDTPAPASNNAPKSAVSEMPQLYYSATRVEISAPFIHRHPPKSKVVDKGENVMFDLIASGHPAPEVIWTRRGRSIDFNELLRDGRKKYIITNLGERYVFEIRQVDPQDSDEYRFRFRNEYGEAASNSKLLVMK